MNCAVNKDAAIASCIADKESGLVTQIAGVGANHEWGSDGSLLVDLVTCVAVGSIKSPREAGHDLDRRLAPGSVQDRLRLDMIHVSTDL